LVSATIHITIDVGSAIFTVLIPTVKMTDVQGASTNITTIGITTLHKFSGVPTFLMGQIDHYTAVALTGTVILETYVRANP
jgi:hypothetical protein